MSHAGTRWIAVFAVWACVLAVPAIAGARGVRWERVAEPTPWQQLDETQFSPNVKLAVANGVPYVASLDKQGLLTVWRTNRRETSWQQLGGPLNHIATQRVREVSLATSGRTVWVAWVEEHQSSGTAGLHLAKLAGDSFREVVSGDSPISGTDPAGGV